MCLLLLPCSHNGIHILNGNCVDSKPLHRNIRFAIEVNRVWNIFRIASEISSNFDVLRTDVLSHTWWRTFEVRMNCKSFSFIKQTAVIQNAFDTFIWQQRARFECEHWVHTIHTGGMRNAHVRAMHKKEKSKTQQSVGRLREVAIFR